MKWRPEMTVLVLIMLLSLGSRLFIAFETPYFSSPDSYDVLRQVEHIRASGRVLIFDALSQGGSVHIVPPLFYYIVALFWAVFASPIVLKVIPNVAAILIIPIVYAIVNHITKNTKASLFAAFVSAFIPGFVESTFNDLTALSFAIPLLFLLMYALLRIEQPVFLYVFIMGMMLFTILSPLVFIFVLGFVLYLIIVKTDNFSGLKREAELCFFCIFLVLWTQFLLYKKAFLLHGASIIYQNVPWQILSSYFEDVSIFGIVSRVGVLSFIIGLYVVYKFTFRLRGKDMSLLVSFALVSLILLWLKLIPLSLGLMLLGVLFAIFFGTWYNLFSDYLVKTKFASHVALIDIALILIIIVSSVIPSFVFSYRAFSTTISPEFMNSMQWVRASTPPDSVIFSTAEEGSMISYFTGRKNVLDLQFLMVPSINAKWDDAREIVVSPFQSNAVELITKYDVDYLFISPSLLAFYDVSSLKYLNTPCMDVVYDKEIMIVDVRNCRWVEVQPNP